MKRDELLERLFPQGIELAASSAEFFAGGARVGAASVAVVGTANAAELGVDLLLRISEFVLQTLRRHPGRAIVMLLDTQGQRLRRREELLGLNGYMAHLAKVLEVARQRGHRILSLVYGQAVSGGYLTTGMMADAAYALADAEIKVMNLPAMARITKIPLPRLEALAQESPVFSPGVENYHRMGHLAQIWQGDLAARLLEALEGPPEPPGDHRMLRGQQRGGRTSALGVAQAVAGAVVGDASTAR